VAHADHGIQMESGKVGRMVRGLAATYAVPFELGELNLGPDATETTARRARYAWLTQVQRRHAARYLVTAHHADDQVETILLRVLKGSGPAGLAGMPARGRGGIVRPLLPFSRAELAAYVAERGLVFHDDPTAIPGTCGRGSASRCCRSSPHGSAATCAPTCCGWDGRPRSSGARGTVRWNSFRSFGFSAPPRVSTLLAPPCPAMMRHCRLRCCGPPRGE